MPPVAALPINENIDFDVCDSGPSGYIAPPKRVRCRGGLKKCGLRTNLPMKLYDDNDENHIFTHSLDITPKRVKCTGELKKYSLRKKQPVGLYDINNDGISNDSDDDSFVKASNVFYDPNKINNEPMK